MAHEVPVTTSFIPRPRGEKLRDGLWLQLLPEDDADMGTDVGGMVEGELVANSPPCNSFSGN